MSRRIFLDANVLLDPLMDREPFAEDVAEIWSTAERRDIAGSVSAITFPLVCYVVRRWGDRRTAAFSGSARGPAFFPLILLPLGER